jgi:hypothetical protein
MQPGAHGDNLHNVLAKNHIPNDLTLGTLQILTAHTWANIYLVAPSGSKTAGNNVLKYRIKLVILHQNQR